MTRRYPVRCLLGDQLNRASFVVPTWHPLGLTGWRTGTPMLVLGSHAWNTPDAKGQLYCGKADQEAVFEACGSLGATRVHQVVVELEEQEAEQADRNQDRAAGVDAMARAAVQMDEVIEGARGLGRERSSHPPGPSDQRRGPGLWFVVPTGSTHHSFDDVLPRFGSLPVVRGLVSKFDFGSHGGPRNFEVVDEIAASTAAYLHARLRPAPGGPSDQDWDKILGIFRDGVDQSARI